MYILCMKERISVILRKSLSKTNNMVIQKFFLEKSNMICPPKFQKKKPLGKVLYILTFNIEL